MPVQTRCPSCGAALAPAAVWCSLCHADLRPRLEPVSVARDVVPSSSPPAASASPEVSTSPGSTLVDERPARGRHSRDVPADAPAPAPPSGSGRHAGGSRRPAPSRSGRRARADVLDLELPAAGEPLDPEQLDVLADQMLTRLAVSEPRQHFLDPSDLPGGKALFIAGCSSVLLGVLVLLYTIIGLVLR